MLPISIWPLQFLLVRETGVSQRILCEVIRKLGKTASDMMADLTGTWIPTRNHSAEYRVINPLATTSP